MKSLLLLAIAVIPHLSFAQTTHKTVGNEVDYVATVLSEIGTSHTSTTSAFHMNDGFWLHGWHTKSHVSISWAALPGALWKLVSRTLEGDGWSVMPTSVPSSGSLNPKEFMMGATRDGEILEIAITIFRQGEGLMGVAFAQRRGKIVNQALQSTQASRAD